LVADQETLVLLKRFSRNPGVEKARAEFEKAQEVEERFLHDFDGVDFTMRYPPSLIRSKRRLVKDPEGKQKGSRLYKRQKKVVFCPTTKTSGSIQHDEIRLSYVESEVMHAAS
jgi:hypothetical protein